MSLFDQYFKHVPDYYDGMEKDGFTPEETLFAFRKMMRSELADTSRKDDKQNLSSVLKDALSELLEELNK